MCDNQKCLDTLAEIHEIYPTLRICQVISNIFNGRDIYYIQDKILYAELKDVLVKIKEEKCQ